MEEKITEMLEHIREESKRNNEINKRLVNSIIFVSAFWAICIMVCCGFYFVNTYSYDQMSQEVTQQDQTVTQTIK